MKGPGTGLFGPRVVVPVMPCREPPAHRCSLLMSVFFFDSATNEVLGIELQPILIYAASSAVLRSSATNEK